MLSFFAIFCHFFVISLSFYCHFIVILLSFWERENEEKKMLKMTTMTDLLLSRGSTKYKEQVQKLLESQPAVKKDRAGELALGNSFLGLPGRGVVSPGSGCRAGSKTGSGVKWPGGGRLRPEKRGRPGNSKNATLPAREFFCIS